MNCLAPSILSADFAKLGEQVRELDEAGAQYVHIDVMDGMFVPSISFGMPVIRSLRPCSDRIFDVHLMIGSWCYISEFAAAGADLITVHAESCKHLDRTVESISDGTARRVALKSCNASVRGGVYFGEGGHGAYHVGQSWIWWAEADPVYDPRIRR